MLQTDFPGYNDSLPGGFLGTVNAWQVGAPALVPTTDTLWFPQLNLLAGNASAPASPAPAVRFNLTLGVFEGFAPAITNATALAYDPANGLLYAAQPRNDTVGGYSAITGVVSGPTYKVGGDPVALAFDPPTHYLFVANKGTNNVTVINTEAGNVAYSAIPVGTGPVALADDPADEWVFVANEGSAFLSAINASSPGSAVPPTLLRAPALAATYDGSTKTVGVTIPSTINMTILDAKSRAALTSVVPVGRGAGPIVPTANGSYFIVANSSDNALTQVDAVAGTVVPTKITVQLDPEQLALDPNTGELWVWSNTSRDWQSFNTSSGALLVTSATLGLSYPEVSYDGVSGGAFVEEAAADSLVVLDPYSSNAVHTPLHLLGSVTSLATGTALNEVFVGSTGSVRAYNATTGALVTSTTTLAGPNGPLLLDPSTGTLWVGRPASNEILGLNAATLLGVATWSSITVNPAAFQSMALDPVDSYLFAADASTGKLDVFNATSHVRVATGLAVGQNTTALAWDPLDGLVYAAGTGQVEAINGANFASEGVAIPIPHGGAATGIAFDASRGTIFLASEAGAALSGTLVGIPATSAPEANETLSVLRLGEGPSSVVVAPPANGSVAGLSSILVLENLSGAIALVGTPPSIGSFTFVPPAIDVGGSTLADVIPGGGAGSSAISFLGLPAGCSSADEIMLSCTPNAAGTYGVQATVTDALGESATANATLQVNGSLSVGGTFGTLPSPESDVGVQFPVSATASGGTPPFQYVWSFGDGGVGSGPTATHTYRAPGLFVASVTGTDAAGGRAIASQVVDVTPVPVASIRATPSSSTDVEVSLGLAASVSGGTTPGAGSWAFGDGQTSTSTQVSHAWATAGRYNVTYNYTDASGVPSDAVASIDVNPVLTGTFSVAPTGSAGAFGTSATFGFTANLTGGTPPISVTWSFGDGSQATGPTVQHVYGAAGSYDVAAVATDAAGAILRSAFLVVASSPSASPTPWWGGTFVPAVVLGLVVGGAGAAVALFSADRSRRPPRPGPPSAYVPPDAHTIRGRD